MNCPHRIDGRCEIAAGLLKRDGVVPLCADDAHAVCRARHEFVTLSAPGTVASGLAIGWLRENDPDASAEIGRLHGYGIRETLQAVAKNPDGGPGTELNGLIAGIGVEEKPGCACKSLMYQMDVWGVSGCRENRKEIVTTLKANYQRYGWGDVVKAAATAVANGLAFKLNPLDPWGSLTDEAIRLAEAKALPVAPAFTEPEPAEIAPVRSREQKRAWEGSLERKPWDYRVTAVVPVLDTPEELEIVVGLLRLQTERPYILIVDTGSLPENWQRIEALQAADVEVHRIASNGWIHASDPVAVAMDLATSRCATPFLFGTHSDCFLRRREVLADMMALCETHKAVGYEISPRRHPDWKGMLGHTCTMFHVATLDKINAGWSLRRLCTQHGLKHIESANGYLNWPDTELLINYQLRAAGITPYIMGGEANMARNQNADFDHCRSFTCGKLYAMTNYQKKVAGWMVEAKREARQRIAAWSQAV